MLTRIDIATFEPRYRRFRAELYRCTQINTLEFALWAQARGDLLARAWSVSAPPGATNHDCNAWMRWQYARATGRVA